MTSRSKSVAPASRKRNNAADRLTFLLPLAHGIAANIARRVPPDLYDDVFAAARLGAWLCVVRRPELEGEPLKAYARHRVRGAVLDELRRQDWTPRRMRQQGVNLPHLGFDDIIGNEADVAASAPATQDEEADVAREIARLRGALEVLDPRRRRVLVGSVCRDVSVAELARELGVSQPRVSQLKAQAIARVRERLAKP